MKNKNLSYMPAKIRVNESMQDYALRLQDEADQLKASIAIHVREDGQYLGDGISNDKQAVDGFLKHWNPAGLD